MLLKWLMEMQFIKMSVVLNWCKMSDSGAVRVSGFETGSEMCHAWSLKAPNQAVQPEVHYGAKWSVSFRRSRKLTRISTRKAKVSKGDDK
jgi:hypothetical protein